MASEFRVAPSLEVERNHLMSRYFCDLADDFAPVIDEEGVICDDDASAAEHAVWCAREIAANDILAGRPVRLASYISLQDEARNEIARVYFRDVITIIPDPS